MNADHKYFIKKLWKHTEMYNYLSLQITNSTYPCSLCSVGWHLSLYSHELGRWHWQWLLRDDMCAGWGVKILSDDILEQCGWHLDPIKPLAMQTSHHFNWSYGIANTLSAPYVIAWEFQCQQSTARLPAATGERLWRPGSSYGCGLCWGKNSPEGPGWPARHPGKPS